MKLRRYFGAGILVILPAFITAYALYFIFQFMDGIWGKLVNIYLKKHYGFAIPGIGVILGLLTILIVGFIATNFLGKRIIHGLERWIMRLPLVRQIYPAAKQIIVSLVDEDKKAFKKVVMVEYPCKGIWTVGFLTNESFDAAQKAAGEELLHVFIGTSPSPITGFLILVPKHNVKFLEITVEEGIKLIVSGGIVKP